MLVYLHSSGVGLGNKLESLVSTMLLALFSGRAFVVDWNQPPGDDMFNRDCGYQDLFSPSIASRQEYLQFIQRNQSSHQGHQGYMPVVQSSLLNELLGMEFRSYPGFLLQSIQHTNVRDWCLHFLCPNRVDGISPSFESSMDEAFLLNESGEDPFSAMFGSAKIVAIDSNQWIGEFLRHHPIVGKQVHNFFKEGGIALLYELYLQPSASIRAEMDQFMKKHNWTAYPSPIDVLRGTARSKQELRHRQVYGLQIRMTEGWPISQNARTHFVPCVAMIHELLNPWNQQQQQQLRQHRLRKVQQTMEKAALFLATDDPQTRQWLLDFVRSHAEQLQFEVIYDDAPYERWKCGGIRRGLFDMYLLGQSDSLVFSSASTFGYMAYARYNVPSWQVTKDTGLCIPVVEAIPCTHMWHYVPEQCGACPNAGKLFEASLHTANRWSCHL